MITDDANSSWHPAFMPNDSIPPIESTDSEAPATDDVVLNGQTKGSDAPVSSLDSFVAVDGGGDDGDAWFADEPADDWPDLDRQVPTATHVEPEVEAESQHAPEADSAPQEPEPEPEREPEPELEPDAALPEPEPQPTNTAEISPDSEQNAPATDAQPALGHASSVSFARTVSHEINFGEEEDPEWNLSRTDTDPFKFMPPTDRTNSFPVVPPQPTESNSIPAPTANFDDKSGLVARGHSPVPETQEMFPEQADNLDDNAPWDHPQVAGGQLSGNGDDLGSRFEEGLPLIPRASKDGGDQQNGPVENGTGYNHLFGNEPSGDDDFFSQIQDDSAPGASHPDPEASFSLERKSTIQVLGSLGATPLSRADTLDDTPEELDEAAAEVFGGARPQEPTLAEPTEELSQDPFTANAGAENAVNAAPEDLSAKWEAAFAGDDDDELLLEDTPADSKPVDPAAFFGSDDEGFLEDEEEETSPNDAAQATASQNESQPPPSSNAMPPPPSRSSTNSRYLPQNIPAPPNPVPQASYGPTIPQPQTLAYSPALAPAPQFSTPTPPAPQQAHAQIPPMQAAYGGPPPPATGSARPEPTKAQSFADKGVAGYTSPYDLPMDFVKPRKRASMQNLARTTPASGPPAVPPPRSSSMHVQGPPSGPPPPANIPGSHPSPVIPQQPQMPAVQKKESFFQELPVTSRSRPASRQRDRLPSPAQSMHQGPPQAPPQAPPQGPPHGIPQGLPRAAQYAPAEPSPLPEPPQPDVQPAATSPSGVPNLVAPPRVSPYAALQSHPQPAPVQNNRYSPAPVGGPPNATAPERPRSSSRYSPAPPGQRPSVTSYGSTPQASVLPHQPRTSSPLAHFAASHERPQSAPGPQDGDPVNHERRIGSHHEPRLNRVPSLPPTQEVEEEEAKGLHPSHVAAAAGPPTTPGMPTAEARYSPMSPPQQQHTPPPAFHNYGQPSLSPPKRAGSNYMPQQPAPHSLSPEQMFSPPQRSQTQSPGSLYGNRAATQTAELPRPSSMHGPAQPYPAQPQPAQGNAYAPSARPADRPRGQSQSFDMVAPTDGRENDPLQRWKGAPILSWGLGGTVVTSFPKDVPRYGMSQTAPMVIRTPGEVRIQNVKDLKPAEANFTKFPGPLRGKSKKKEAIAWLTSGIEELEARLTAAPSYQTGRPHDEKRATERVLLWKILRVFVEFDGALEGNPQVEKAVRDVLAPGLESGGGLESSDLYGGIAPPTSLQEAATTEMRADGVDSSTVDQIRKYLLLGDREKAVWSAVDKRLWGHAMLISNTVSPELYKQVAQEFVRKEVNYPGHNNESIAALYEVLSGNQEESVDELVPSHARAGLQLVNTASSFAAGPTKDATEGLDKWRETVGLIVSNRSHDDVRALNALGNLLSTYGRPEAAHICYLFGRKVSVFGGLDDPAASFVLVGADHKAHREQFAKETEALLLSEVYEFGQSLANGSMPGGVPHLAAYKYYHAVTLAEYGFRDKAIQYCEAIASSMTAQTKRSPYHHPLLESAVDDLAKRLKQTPGGESSSWISKPSMNKVSDSMWNRFNKFVAGDENDRLGTGAPGEGGHESGPFARVASGTPTISPSPSVSNFEVYGNTSPGYPVSATSPLPPATRAASRYAPVPASAGGAAPAAMAQSPYEPAMPMANATARPRSSLEYQRNAAEAPRTSLESLPTGYPGTGGPSPNLYSPPGYGGMPPQGATTPRYSPTHPAVAATTPELRVSDSSASESFTPYGGMQAAQPAAAQPELAPAFEGNPQPTFGYQPPSFVPNDSSSPEAQPTAETSEGSGGYEAPSYQPYSYEPPSYNPEPEPEDGHENGDAAEPRQKKKSFMDDDGDDMPALRAPKEKTREEKDRENEEMFKRVAEEDAKRAAEQPAKKGWGFSGWWGGGKKDASLDAQQTNKPIRAKLGEASSFVYDPELKRWVNKKAGAEQTEAKKATPPPPRATGPPRPSSGTPPPAAASAPPMAPGAGPPGGPLRPASMGGGLPNAPSQENLGMAGAPPPPMGLAGPPAMARTASNTSGGGPPSGPPSRPTTSMSNASSIDDLLSGAGPRKPGGKKARKSGRYVDVMAK